MRWNSLKKRDMGDLKFFTKDEQRYIKYIVKGERNAFTDRFVALGDPFDKPAYTLNPIIVAIPWISGIVMPVIPFTIVFGYHWLAIFFINLAVVYLLGPTLTRMFLARFSTGKNLVRDMFYSLVGGIITLIIGLILH